MNDIVIRVLTEKITALEAELRSKDTYIANLEGDLEREKAAHQSFKQREQARASVAEPYKAVKDCPPPAETSMELASHEAKEKLYRK